MFLKFQLPWRWVTFDQTFRTITVHPSSMLNFKPEFDLENEVTVMLREVAKYVYKVGRRAEICAPQRGISINGRWQLAD